MRPDARYNPLDTSSKLQPYSDYIKESAAKLNGHLINVIDVINSKLHDHNKIPKDNVPVIRHILSRTAHNTAEVFSIINQPDQLPAKDLSEAQLRSTFEQLSKKKLLIPNDERRPQMIAAETIAAYLSIELASTINRVTYLLNPELRTTTIPLLIDKITNDIRMFSNSE